MSDKDQRPVVSEQKFFEPGDRADVEMIGRLIQQQQVRLAHQSARQHDLSARPAGAVGKTLVCR